MDDQIAEVVQCHDNKTAINTWYAACRPRFIDLIGDYAGKELFLLESSSLLRECFSDDRLDFHD
jgi:ATP-dependent RNA helicase DDX60